VGVAILGVLSARDARAQGAARSLDIDASIRFAGAGGACNAVFWGGDPNDWANPALLGYHRGVRYSHGNTQLVPGIGHVFFKTDRLTVGMGGVGVLLPGNLTGFGTTLLDYGLSEGTDEQGNPTGTFRSFEKIRAWGIGVSLSELLASAARMAGAEPPAFLRYADVAAGYGDKHVVVHLGPGLGGQSETNARDFGVLVRATPIDGIDHHDEVVDLPVRLDLSYGYSILNYNDAFLTFINEDLASPTSRIFRNGYAARAALGLPEWLGEKHGGWLGRSLTPLVSVSFASDKEHIQAGDGGSEYDVKRWGGELEAANILTLRTGHVTDRLGDIVGKTSGFGLGFRLGDLAGFRHDWASIPQARNSGLPRVKRRGFTAYVDPLRLIRLFTDGWQRES
jgi:hypothetical protein